MTPGVGMEVTGVDLSNPTDEDIEFILEAFHTHAALLFRDQNLSNEALISFSPTSRTMTARPLALWVPARPYGMRICLRG